MTPADRDRLLQSLLTMEPSGGEPDAMGHDPANGQVMFCGCSAESPAGRKSLCYDREALDARKDNKPRGCAIEVARRSTITMVRSRIAPPGAFAASYFPSIVAPRFICSRMHQSAHAT